MSALAPTPVANPRIWALPRLAKERKLALPEAAEHWLLTTLREKLMKIGAKVVRHGRYVTFQLAEVAVPRSLLQKILGLIDDLRRRPAPAQAGKSTARRKRQERCVWMARKMTEWSSKRRPLTKIRPSDGCKGDGFPLAVDQWYNFHEPGGHQGNVG